MVRFTKEGIVEWLLIKSIDNILSLNKQNKNTHEFNNLPELDEFEMNPGAVIASALEFCYLSQAVTFLSAYLITAFPSSLTFHPLKQNIIML